MDGILPILYRDEHLVAVDKPPGLLVHRTAIASDGVFALQLLRDQLRRKVYPVHRLDRPTSGVLVFALSSEVASRLVDQFASRQIVKTYLAVTRGFIEPEGTLDYPLRENRDAPKQEAVTAYRRLSTVELDTPIPPHATARYSLVEARPRTGRMHQVRKHLKHLSHPIIGDTAYGDSRHNRFFRDRLGIRRLLLLARRIRLTHPVMGEPLAIEAPLPADMRGVFDLFGWA